MKRKSKFTSTKDKLSIPKRHFESWLMAQAYESVSDAYPAAVLAISLVDEYLDDCTEYARFRVLIEQHAENIGWISNYEFEDETDDDIVDPEEERP